MLNASSFLCVFSRLTALAVSFCFSAEWVYQDITSCCTRYFGWMIDTCVVSSGGNSTTLYTQQWYVNSGDEICQQDCDEDNGGSCGGLIDSWKQSYSTAAECCEATLNWISSPYCEAKSLLPTADFAGSSLWYADYQNGKCVQDCASPGVNGTCGGVITAGHIELFETSASCCSGRLGYLDQGVCTASSTNSELDESAGTNEWYIDNMRCVQDCVGSAPCGGLKNSWDQTFSSSGDCCSTGLWWLEVSTCLDT